MPFTDQALADTMRDTLVASGVMTAQQQAALLEDPTEVHVAATLNAGDLGHFGAYWAALGVWMNDAHQGGNQALTTGLNVPGRVGGNPAGLAPRSLYNDAFNDVTQHINQPDFSAVRAVSSQLRFINNIV